MIKSLCITWLVGTTLYLISDWYYSCIVYMQYNQNVPEVKQCVYILTANAV